MEYKALENEPVYAVFRNFVHLIGLKIFVMTLKKKLICLFTLLLCISFGPVMGQTVYDLNFQGVLSDIEGQRVVNESFDLKVELKHVSGSEKLFEFSSVTQSDEEGWFGFNISEISKFLNGDNPFSEPVLIKMEILPNSSTKWMKPGEDFVLSYTLKSTSAEGQLSVEMTRMEGSKLQLHTEEHLHAFKDEYPFAYITGGFLLSDQSPLEQELIKDLKRWIVPDESDEEGAASRGVKGGFPTGGYYRKK